MSAYGVLRDRALFRLGGGDAETAHERTLDALARFGRFPMAVAASRRWALGDAPGLARTLFGVPFPGPVGLAAGMDKNGVALPAWAGLGFGFVEVGTVTAHGQPGNPRPRLFRLPESEAIVNRMGFNNRGAAALAARLADLSVGGRPPLPVPVGVSLGKSKVTPLDAAVEDYLRSLRAVHRYADYVAVNVSSPNTPGLRALQDRSALDSLVGALAAEAAALRDTPGPRRPAGRAVPLVVKIAPDLTDAAVGEVLEVCAAHGVAGVIVSNTTLGRAGVTTTEAGGLSGAPLAARARDLVRFVVQETAGRLPVIGVGGILTPADATAMFDRGAALIQLYTGLVYRGPGLVRAINKSVTQRGVGRLSSAEAISDPLRAPQSAPQGALEGRVTTGGPATLSGPVAGEGPSER
ncbi:quinone-dependent dihydroorotate dehydrogenase [Cryptosporangium phraense]|uniref:Dihydroorotate dehydrogenase (quinone) n=1 Tax=Cryptosporangium phraense TaxID=2593070 RepID=A0A545AK09_9ACTN|nr:quinone-dependent dihydroorotate dehydrogenase [Cryptosporangium phraense]TQS41629.1 quinone-dependent dihydroorotate dehydrogenase [Cryptosporangium phraense]